MINLEAVNKLKIMQQYTSSISIDRSRRLEMSVQNNKTSVKRNKETV